MNVKGRWAQRLKDNPEERRFAKAWDKANVLRYLLGDGIVPVDPTEQEAVVAATVIQWLGSPVGQGFLHDLGYMKSPALVRQLRDEQRLREEWLRWDYETPRGRR